MQNTLVTLTQTSNINLTLKLMNHKELVKLLSLWIPNNFPTWGNNENIHKPQASKSVRLCFDLPPLLNRLLFFLITGTEFYNTIIDSIITSAVSKKTFPIDIDWFMFTLSVITRIRDGFPVESEGFSKVSSYCHLRVFLLATFTLGWLIRDKLKVIRYIFSFYLLFINTYPSFSVSVKLLCNNANYR